MRSAILSLLVVASCAHAPASSPPPVAAPAPAATPSVAAPAPPAPPKPDTPPVLDDLGAYHRAITTSSPEAQRWFDQGLRLLYAFNHFEAERAFHEASRIDPTCAMCACGEALVLGPNYNMPAMPERQQAAWRALGDAKARAAKGSAVEQALIGALEQRYTATPAGDDKAQASIDSAYAVAMRAVAQRFPDDDDVQVLFAESMMDLHPWKLWKQDGSPGEHTEEIVATLERVLARHPEHPGANHYYIHALEASPHPERALAAAERVGGMMPGAGHLVHMPSHVYERVGRYEEAAEANRQAIAADKRYLAKTPPPGMYGMYVAHNFQFLWAAAMMAGRADEALAASRDMLQQVPPEMWHQMAGMDFVVPAPSLSLVRFGRWDEVLKEARPAADLPLGTALDRYARARALTALGRLDEAEVELKALEAVAIPEGMMSDMAPSRALVHIADEIARGELELRRKHTREGLAHLEAAVAAEDQLPYAEPPDWYYPARHTLGARLVSLGKLDAAEKVYREDLRRNPKNGWSLVGLRECLQKRHRATIEVDPLVEQAFKTADRKIEHSDF